MYLYTKYINGVGMKSIVVDMSAPQTCTPREPFVPKIPIASCPIRASLGILGRKWILPVLRDIAFYRDVRFSDILRKNSGLTPRVLTFRLQELQSEGFIKRKIREGNKRDIFYELTSKGKDTIPILTAFTYFGMRHHPGIVFDDGRPRNLSQVLPGAQRELLRGLADYAINANGSGLQTETHQLFWKKRTG
jgi:DNA-binding HxlR family transcriptional regulator